MHSMRILLVATSLLLCLVGCATKTPPEGQVHAAATTAKDAVASGETLLLREGDTVRLTFAGAPNLNTVQSIRRDGKLSLPLVGEVQAAGLSPAELQKKLIEVYGPQLQTKEVTVVLDSPAFPVYVTGAVLRPGKIVSDRPLTALEAIMEAGGFDYGKANLKKVRVIRYDQGTPRFFDLNLKAALQGKESEPFNLNRSDIIYVPEKFSWF
jgi:polysaccharide export outer membrane protein